MNVLDFYSDSNKFMLFILTWREFKKTINDAIVALFI